MVPNPEGAERELLKLNNQFNGALALANVVVYFPVMSKEVAKESTFFAHIRIMKRVPA